MIIENNIQFIIQYKYIIVLLSCISLLFLLFTQKKNEIISFFFIPQYPDQIIHCIYNTFNYSYIHNKNIIIIINQKIMNRKNKNEFYASFSYQLTKLLLSTQYSHFIFLITKEGILYDFYYDFQNIDYTNLINNKSFIIEHDKEYNQYDIKSQGILFKNNAIQKAILLIKEFLFQKK